ncbi:MAG: hypothetical protein QM808_12135 [Steroidobacteraceae bacterium]
MLIRKALPVVLLLTMLGGCNRSIDSLEDETRAIEAWREQRVTNLTSEDGWLTLAGLFWLQEGDNRFGRSTQNQLVLDHPALQNTVGTFELHEGKVSFTAAPRSGVTHDGDAVTHIRSGGRQRR